ncbi:hypothetical protein [Labrenzia sp. PHM005]|uniref:hypothetical protein n=1 Tax=Labrenzia sp. PHM005 TaxID=2590016 RepID=UPI0011400256|nr:hypothetical protein [Labrenzia sp. PHM005]QDG76732.1 hypothetical protein FJ695_13090 [Labrenzia sp. PHM005]
MQLPSNFLKMALVAAFLGAAPASAAGMRTACYEKVHQPAVYKNITRTIMTHRAHTAWENRIINGRDVLCKVHRPAVYQKVRQNVMVHPARTVLRPVRNCNQNVRISSNF